MDGCNGEPNVYEDTDLSLLLILLERYVDYCESYKPPIIRDYSQRLIEHQNSYIDKKIDDWLAKFDQLAKKIRKAARDQAVANGESYPRKFREWKHLLMGKYQQEMRNWVEAQEKLLALATSGNKEPTVYLPEVLHPLDKHRPYPVECDGDLGRYVNMYGHFPNIIIKKVEELSTSFKRFAAESIGESRGELPVLVTYDSSIVSDLIVVEGRLGVRMTSGYWAMIRVPEADKCARITMTPNGSMLEVMAIVKVPNYEQGCPMVRMAIGNYTANIIAVLPIF